MVSKPSSSPAAVVRAKNTLGELGSHVREADFFGLPLARERFEVVYERAFLCALPRRLWAQWATRVADLIAPAGCLIGFFYFGQTEKGPPFGIDTATLTDLLSGYFELIEEVTPKDSIAVFAGKEKWQVWLRR